MSKYQIKLTKEIKLVGDFIKYLEKEYGRKICKYGHKKDFSPGCTNCQAQWTLGFLREHLSTLKWELRSDIKISNKTK